MSSKIYSKPIAFALLATGVILIGTLATTFLPMMSPDMHPKLETLRPMSPLELAGRDIYQREGCVNCHTQTVRPLKTEVMRYGEYSKAGEFAYDRPFLWGSKRTGPDLARIGGKYPDIWHVKHFENPPAVVARSNMPAYGWMKANALDAGTAKSHMDTLGLPYKPEDIKALEGKNELDALVAYVQWLGHAVRPKVAEAASASIMEEANPLAGNHEAQEHGHELYSDKCAGCHGDKGEGGIGPSLSDGVWLNTQGSITDSELLYIVLEGTTPGLKVGSRSAAGGMPPYKAELGKQDAWAIVAYLRTIGPKGSPIAEHEAAENKEAGQKKEAGKKGPESSAAKAGKEVFEANCKSCHGEGGVGGFGPKLTDNVWLGKEGDITDARLVEIISGGTQKGMPAWGKVLSAADIDKLVAYIRSLGQKK